MIYLQNPTILVGVGGSGCRIVDRVVARAKAGGLGANDRLVAAGFDTDAEIHDRTRIRAVARDDLTRFSTAEPVGRILETNWESMKEWAIPKEELPPRNLNFVMTKGAGQVRMFTRMALHQALTTNVVPHAISSALHKLARTNNQDTFEGAVQVVIAGSLAGATGSGSFLQLALLIRDQAKQMGTRVMPEIHGFFLLADVFVNTGTVIEEEVENVRVNTYAALKELNAVNALANRMQSTRNFHYEYAPGREVRVGALPFSSVTLVDFENMKGMNLGRNLAAYEDMAARGVYQLMFTPVGGLFLSGAANNAPAQTVAFAEGKNIDFAGIGVNSIVYPRLAMRDYLALELAKARLDGDWLQLDELYDQYFAGWQALRARGATSEGPPDKGAYMLGQLQTLVDKRSTFFREIDEKLRPIILQERGAPVRRDIVVDYLDAVEAEVINRYWNSAPGLALARNRPKLTASQVQDASQFASRARTIEIDLDDDWRAIDLTTSTTPRDIFLSLYAAALLTRVENDWKESDLPFWIVKPKPHLVQIRLFLYALKKELKDRIDRTDPAQAKVALFALANTWDARRRPGRERGSPEIHRAAADASSGLWARLTRRGEHFRRKLVQYQGTSLDRMRDYAEAEIRKVIYDNLSRELETLVGVVERIFVEVRQVRADVRLEIERAATEHELERGSIAGLGELYVYAGGKDKALAAYRMVADAAKTLQDDSETRATLARSVIDALDKVRRAATDPVTAQNPLQALDRETLRGELHSLLVERDARRAVETGLSQHWKISVWEAIRRQWERRSSSADEAEKSRAGANPKEHLQDLVRLVGGSAEPFVDCIDANAGKAKIFWTINDAVKAEFADETSFERIFRSADGSAPSVLQAHPDSEFGCVSIRTNLSLTDLRKLSRGADEAYAHNVSEGVYRTSYVIRVAKLLSAGAGSVGPKGALPPHIHRAWHRPGALIELFTSESETIVKRINRATVAAFANGVLEKVRRDGIGPVTMLDTSDLKSGGGSRREILRSHDDWSIVETLRDKGEMLAELEASWVQRLAESKTGIQTEQELADLSERLIVLALAHDGGDDRRKTVRDFIMRLYGLKREVIDLARPTATPSARAEETSEALRAATRDALGRLESVNMAEVETLNQLRALLTEAINTAAQESR
jgi:hypothetical protein